MMTFHSEPTRTRQARVALDFRASRPHPDTCSMGADDEAPKDAGATAKNRGGRPLGLRGPLRELAEALGGRRKLAEAIGVNEKQIYRWSEGIVVPSCPTRKVLAALAGLHEIEPPYGIERECARPAWLDEDPDEA